MYNYVAKKSQVVLPPDRLEDLGPLEVRDNVTEGVPRVHNDCTQGFRLLLLMDFVLTQKTSYRRNNLNY